MRRTCLTIAAALAVSLSAFAQDAPPPLAPPMPTIAGGDCGILKQVEMPKVEVAAAVLALRRRARGLLPRPRRAGCRIRSRPTMHD
jgi:hypothetical protein